MTLIDLNQRFRDVEERYRSIEAQLSDPTTAADPTKLRTLSKSHSDLSQVVSKIREFHDVESRLEQARGLVDDSDPDMAEMARAELDELEGSREALMKNIQLLLLPKDPLDEKNIII